MRLSEKTIMKMTMRTVLMMTLLTGQAVSTQCRGWSQCSHVSRHVTQSHVSTDPTSRDNGPRGGDTSLMSCDTQTTSLVIMSVAVAGFRRRLTMLERSHCIPGLTLNL